MTIAEYVVDYLIGQRVTDAFGIPGGVILKFLYAMEARQPEIIPHLDYHEQMAGFAACGYAQASGKLGVAYATRGPGITNMFTCIAEAYQESIPVLFITAHGEKSNKAMRFEYNQEIDIVESVKNITKYAINVERKEDVSNCLIKACEMALKGRKGPVLLDFSAKLWDVEYKEQESQIIQEYQQNFNPEYIKNIIDIVEDAISASNRPVVLIGDGIRQANCIELAKECLKDLNVPILSSRAAQDILSESEMYYGYIGSHASRYSNFILSKTDLIIVIGNRLAFPIKSESFRPIVQNTKIIWLDIDSNEFQRNIPGTVEFCIDVKVFLREFCKRQYVFKDSFGWNDVCKNIKNNLKDTDVSQPVEILSQIVKNFSRNTTYVCDVGNNEFWFSRAYEFAKTGGQVLCSKSYGTLGSAIGKSIGAYYATGEMVVCIVGDQGFQYNIQELQYIAQWDLPIKVLLLNNSISGMIKDHENKIDKNRYVHVTADTGYCVPNFSHLVNGYGIGYLCYNSESLNEEVVKLLSDEKPLVCEILVSEKIQLQPILPKGNACQDLYPPINKELYNYLNNL